MVPIHVTEQVAEQLAEQARACGLSLAEFLARVANNDAPKNVTGERIGDSSSETTQRAAETDRRLAVWDAIFKSMRDAVPKNLPPGHFVDDSRESIYGGPDGRGE